MKKYYEPYRLSLLQRAFLTPYFGVKAIMNPTRGDFVAGLGDVTSVAVIHRLKDQLVSSVTGKELLARKPLITVESLNLPNLRSLPEGTLGRGYVHYMDSHGFSADERSIVRFMDDPDLAYTMVRYRQVHDFWHVLSGLPPSELGEIALKAFEFRVTGLPVCALSALLGPLRLRPSQIALLYSTYVPWAIRAGVACRDLLAYPYEDNLHLDVGKVRDALCFEPAPPLSMDR
eukprot:gene42126-51440_t